MTDQNPSYAEAIAYARAAAKNASSPKVASEREAWARTAEAWIAIAREIREVER